MCLIMDLSEHLLYSTSSSLIKKVDYTPMFTGLDLFAL
jgi:hypothetical protein